MKTTYNEKDLVSFGNYLLSKERKIMFKENKNKIHHSDFENWKNNKNDRNKRKNKIN